MRLTCAVMQTNHSTFGLDVDIRLTALNLPLPPVGPSIGLIAVDQWRSVTFGGRGGILDMGALPGPTITLTTPF